MICSRDNIRSQLIGCSQVMLQVVMYITVIKIAIIEVAATWN